MKIIDLFNNKKTVFSFEVFPPKKTSPIETLFTALDKLKEYKPDYISVTYGAGGSIADLSTVNIANTIKTKYGIEPLAHLACVNYSKDEILFMLEKFKENNIENILALRGDKNPNIEPKNDFKYASELVDFIKKNHPEFSVAGACYPEVHFECENMEKDIENLKIKVDSGVSHLTTQLFFDNDAFYTFLNKVRQKGINVPIQAGIMPVVNGKNIQRMVSLCGASLPAKFSRIIQKYDSHPEALKEAGIAYAVNQIVDLISNGVDGIHLYTMNNPYVASKICDNIKTLVDVSR